MIPEGTDNHIADSKADNENEFLKIRDNLLRDELAKKEGSPYHETSKARVLAFINGWNACRENEHIGKLIKKWGEAIYEKSQLQSTIEELKKENEELKDAIKSRNILQEEDKKEIEELKQKVSDLTFDNMTYEYNEAEGNEVWPQIEEQIREDEREKLKSIIEEKDNEIERLKGLIEDAHEAGYNDGTFNNDMTISESWEQFKAENNL